MFKSIISLFLAVALFGCNDDQLDVVIPTTENYDFNMKLPVDPSTGEPTEAIEDIKSYAFQKDLFVKLFENIIVGIDGDFTMYVPQNSKLYFTSNIVEPISLTDFEVNTTTLNNLLTATTTSVENLPDNSAPNFYSGSYIPTTNLVTESSRNSIEMTRSTARLDIGITNPKILVEKIEIKNTSRQTYVFKNPTPFTASPKTNYVKSYDPALNDDTLDLFRLYESDTDPVTVIISAKYGNISMMTSVDINKIERNKSYKIVVTSDGTTIEGTFTIAPWEPGDTITADPIQPVK